MLRARLAILELGHLLQLSARAHCNEIYVMRSQKLSLIFRYWQLSKDAPRSGNVEYFTIIAGEMELINTASRLTRAFRSIGGQRRAQSLVRGLTQLQPKTLRAIVAV